MNEPKNLVFKLEGNTLIIEVDTREANLIATILAALVVFVNKGSPLRITRCFSQSLSMSQSMLSTIIWKTKEMVAWADDLKRLIRSHQTKLGV
jgi:hypothetical protein